MDARDDRGVILKLKLSLPGRAWRPLTRPAARALGLVPRRVKYALGLAARRNRMPYAAIGPGDVAVQIGAPSDLLAVGRSRAAFFLHLVSEGGRLVVIEPDPACCRALEAFAREIGRTDRLLVVEAGAWSERTELEFYQNPSHPASAMLAGASTLSRAELEARGYRRISVPVTTLDRVLAEHGLPAPRLVSITTNGSEIEILKGMTATLATGGVEYISLAVTGEGYATTMERMGYRHHADDDRGFTFRRAP